MRHLHWLNDSIDDHCGPQPCAEPKKKHSTAVINAESLHGRIIQDLNRVAERLLEIESDPPAAEIVGVGERAPVDHWPRISKRDAIIFPVRCGCSNLLDHFLRRHLRTRGKLDW